MDHSGSTITQERDGSRVTRTIVVGGILGVVLAIGFAAYRATDLPGGVAPQVAESAGVGELDRFELTRRALQATENLELSEADVLWSAIVERAPADASAARNLAITRTIQVEQLLHRASDESVQETEASPIRDRIPTALSLAHDAIDSYSILSDDPVLPTVLSERIKQSEEFFEAVIAGSRPIERAAFADSDPQRDSIDLLSRLDFDSLHRLSAEKVAASPLKPAATDLKFERMTVDATEKTVQTAIIRGGYDEGVDLLGITTDGQLKLWQGDGSSDWSLTSWMTLNAEPTGMVVADFIDDAPPYSRSLVIYGPSGIKLVRISKPSLNDEVLMSYPDAKTGLESIGHVTAAAAGDFDADGHLDLVIATASRGVQVLASHGDGTFAEVSSESSPFSVSDPATAIAVADLDRDGDLDFVAAHTGSGKISFAENRLQFQFRQRYLGELPAIAGASAIAVEDIDGNASWDLIIGGEDSAIVYSAYHADRVWSVDRIETNDHPAPRFLLADINNDSWTDFITVGPIATKVASLGPWGFGPWQYVKSVKVPTLMNACDLHGNGSVDLIGIQDQRIQVFTNVTPSLGKYVDLKLDRYGDAASGPVNRFAIGSVIEIWLGPHYRAKIANSPWNHFGLSDFDTPGTLRVTLPGGEVQTVEP